MTKIETVNGQVRITCSGETLAMLVHGAALVEGQTFQGDIWPSEFRHAVRDWKAAWERSRTS